ncbi:WD repeat-containing protein 36 [Condylostylus longicornis]|uniref:WD repeat-containing protein 36 n=1 Tax=Condylostylus longicornis TaxID=2530218 RepID=UPI00244DB96A|nr:WD repeat-containing protein 36 [Condylostylus longicornis]
MSGSKIFRRNRAMGYVSNHVPANIRYVRRRKDTLITTCVGRAFQVYTASHFRLIHVSDVHPDEITAIAVDKLFTYVASNKTIYSWRFGKEIRHVYKGHNKNVHLLLPFRAHLIAVDEENILKVWDISSETVYLEIPFPNEFLVTALAHPPTYINKMLLGSEQGDMQLWNIKENKLIYTFNGRGSKITVIEPAPALDVVAIGHYDGVIKLLNLKFDEVIMELKQDFGSITQISFRTDGLPIMASSSSDGNVVFWNLEEKKVSSQILAHNASVTTAICLASEPLLLTTSPDNSMKLWVFDMPDGGARLLKIREGHHAPPLCIRYHGSNGLNILSSGEDSSMRIFCLLSESLNKGLGRASYNRKISKKKGNRVNDPLIMPPIVHFTSETTRDKEWDSIAAIHSGIIQTTTWSYHKCKMGDLRLIPEKFFNKNRKDFNTETTCITITHCGNFVIIGYSSGDAERFNIQSGIHRASYGKPSHDAAVRGVACDNLNQMVITGGSDGLIKFWHFKGQVSFPTSTHKLPSGVNMFRSHRESAMLAISLDNFIIYVLDYDARVIVRKFEGHTARITDATFSPDSRWLITAAMDSTIKIWDIPSSYMIDHFKTERPCVSLTMSPTGDFLATAHTNYLGVYLWANKSLYNQLSLRSINPFDEAPYIDLPGSQKDSTNLEDAFEDMGLDGEEIDINYETPEQISENLITLSNLASSRWQNLLDLDIIKKRNKPKAPPKVPKQAPFFLPTVAGTDFKFDLSAAVTDKENLKVNISENFNNLSGFGKLLQDTIQTNDYNVCINYLKSCGPSMIDFEIKSLSPYGGGNYKVLIQFLKMIVNMFNKNIDFELSQAYLATFLKVHSKILIEKPENLKYLKEVEEAQTKSWKILEEKLFYGIGVVTALRNYVN